MRDSAQKHPNDRRKTEPDGPASPSSQAASGLLGSGRPLLQTGRVHPDCGRHSPRLEHRLHSTPDPPQSPQEALAESAPPPEPCSDSGTPLSPLFCSSRGAICPQADCSSPSSCGHGTSWFVRQFFHTRCLQGSQEQPGGMGTVFPLDTRGSERTGDWSEVTQLETTRGRTGSLRLRSELSTLARAWDPVSA